MVIIVMGVSGAGKTTVGRLLAAALGAEFVEGDRFHAPASVAKMRRGVALDDADRRPWLDAMAREIARWSTEGRDVVLACSALKRRYRAILLPGGGEVRLVYLKGSAALIGARLGRRAGHYMPASLLASQLAALEEPAGREAAVTVDVAGAPDAIVAAIVERLRR